MFSVFSHDYYMKEALKEAQQALLNDEIRVGAIIVSGQQIIARAHNETQRNNDVTAHAEILAITAASEHLGAKYLTDCTLYVTLEPCIMCSGALYWSQIGNIVFGASDSKRGFTQINQPILHPRTNVMSGVLADQCSALIKNFFKQKRQ